MVTSLMTVLGSNFCSGQFPPLALIRALSPTIAPLSPQLPALGYAHEGHGGLKIESECNGNNRNKRLDLVATDTSDG